MSKKILAIPFIFALLFAFCSEASAYPPAQNERFAIRSLRNLHSAQITYFSTTGNGNYGTFQNLIQAELIGSALATGLKYGYSFQIVTTARTSTTPAAFYVSARPLGYRKTGKRSFYIDEAGVLRGADKNGAAATVADPEIQDECVPYEQCAIDNLRRLHGAQTTYAATLGSGNFGSFNQLRAAGLISASLATGSSSGYNYSYLIVDRVPGVSEASFKLWAVPITYGVTGIGSFYIDTSGVLRGADKNGELADENDPPIDF